MHQNIHRTALSIIMPWSHDNIAEDIRVLEFSKQIEIKTHRQTESHLPYYSFDHEGVISAALEEVK